MLPGVAAARRRYFASRNAEDRRLLEEIERRVGILHARYSEIATELQESSGIPEEVFAAMEREPAAGDPEPRIQRRDLTKESVATTDDIGDVLADSVDNLRRIIDVDWLEEFSGSRHKLRPEDLERPLSLVRGLRPESEFPPVHRFAQAILVAQDYLDTDLGYDHFAGALLVPQIASLGSKLDLLDAVGGEVEKRIRSLWCGPGQETDATVLELLVAASPDFSYYGVHRGR